MRRSMARAMLAPRVSSGERETDRAICTHCRPASSPPNDNAMLNRSNHQAWSVARSVLFGQPVGWHTARTKS